jgi:hypothetical protein
MTERHLRSSEVYFEGAIQVVRIRQAAARSGERRLPLTLHVRRGRYRVWSATRPCDANCGMLDPPTDSCSATVTAPAKLVITTRVGHACTIRTKP